MARERGFKKTKPGDPETWNDNILYRALRGHRYLTVVYDLERRTLLWVGEDRTEQTLREFFPELGRRRCRTLQVVCMDMWAAYAKAVREHAAQAQILFDRFHLVQHLNRAVDEVRRAQMRRRSRKQKSG